MPLPYGGFVVDTPGLKEFGLWRSTPEDLAGAFPEIGALAGGCRFADCSHVHEPDCAVLEAIADGTIDPDRHASYAKILSEAME
jgi:ribosome biogenesis GTPase